MLSFFVSIFFTVFSGNGIAFGVLLSIFSFLSTETTVFVLVFFTFLGGACSDTNFFSFSLTLSIIFFGLESSYSILLFLIIMLSIGIPHGSVDHIIAFINPEARRFNSKLIFYIVYLSLILINIILWIISPFLGLLIFLLISCYHFGETQVLGYNSTDNKLLNFVIGANILLSLFLNNIIELQEILYILPEFSNLDLSNFESVFFLLISVAVLMLSVTNFNIKTWCKSVKFQQL